MTRTNKFTLPVKVYLRYVEMFGIDGPRILKDDGFHENVIYSKALKSSDKGYTDYGTSPRGSWITEEGKKFLNGENWRVLE